MKHRVLFLSLSMSFALAACSTPPKKLEGAVFETDRTSGSESQAKVTEWKAAGAFTNTTVRQTSMPTKYKGDEKYVSRDIATESKPMTPAQPEEFFVYTSKGGSTALDVAAVFTGSRKWGPALTKANSEVERAEERLSPSASIRIPAAVLSPVWKKMSPEFVRANLTPLKETLEARNRLGNIPYEIVRVQPGDRLTGIAKKLYGSSQFWVEIYVLNHDKIRDPDLVRPGLELKVAVASRADRSSKADADSGGAL